MGTKELSLKLLIDTKAHKVCFAEVGSDVVDFLSSLLFLPLGTVTNLLTTERMVGSIGNVLGSTEKLDANYKSKVVSLSPAVAPATLYRLQELLGSHITNGNTNLFTCRGRPSNTGGCTCAHRYSCTKNPCTCPRATCGYLSATSGTVCFGCKGPMDKPMTRAPEGGAYPYRAHTTYVVKDDLSVTPASNLLSGITLLAQCGVKDISALQEKTVTIGKEEALAILAASLKSKTADGCIPAEEECSLQEGASRRSHLDTTASSICLVIQIRVNNFSDSVMREMR